MKLPQYGKLLLASIVFSEIAIAQESDAFGCADSDTSIACSQKNQVQEIWTDMNKSFSYLTDELIQNPSSAIEAGCLNDINKVDINAIAIDPKSIYSGIYAALKDQILNKAYDAINDKINEASSYLDQRLEAPMGIGSVAISSRGTSDVQSFSDIASSRSRLTNREATSEAVQEVFGEYPKINRRDWTDQSIEEIKIEARGVNTRSQRTEDQERLDSLLDLDRLFKSNVAEEEEQSNEENN